MGSNTIRDLRIGLPIIGNKDWLGGVHYIKSIVEAVSRLPLRERPRLFLVVYDQTLAVCDLHRDILGLLDGIIFFGQDILRARALLPSPVLHCRTRAELDNALDFFYPLVADVAPDLCSASWIYDFQHVYLPEFFPREEIQSRNMKFARVAESAKLVVLSSESAEQDFRRIFPGSKAVTRVLSFRSLPSDEWLALDPSETQKKYSLPDGFLLCCNQFWIHKNHGLLFEAMAAVDRSAPGTCLVCTGAASDWRFQDYFSKLTAFLEKHGLKERIRILGQIPRSDQIQLLRRSLAVIQPSLFEGWSSVVEEARMLGKTIILSDLAVHHEQAPDFAVYFDRNSAKDLTEKILDLLPRLGPGPDHAREQEAKKKSIELVEQFGRNFCSIAVEARRLFGKEVPAAFSSQPLSNKAYTAEFPGPCPKISIVTPSFNQGQFLEECIDSILSQNYPDLEYIIMDGGSTDNSVNIIKKYEKYLTYWQSKPDDGQYAAINEGFKKTTGEIMTWLNSDDILHPKSLETVAGVFSRIRDAEWIMGIPNGIDEYGRQTWVFDHLPLWSREKYLKRQYKHPYIQQEGTFWRRTLWEKAGAGIDASYKLAADMDLWARFFRFSQLYSVDALLGAFRKHSAQKTATGGIEEYNREAERIIDREIDFYRLSSDKTLLPAPSPITRDALSDTCNAIKTVDKTEKADGKEKPLVSAIVSAYNAERFMRGCLEDLVGQTLYQQDKLEIVVVDSGSGQNEKAVVEEFMQRYKNILYIRTRERESVYAAWNRGIKAASGQYITNANTDDRHRKDALEVMASFLDKKPDIGLVYADVLVTRTENETFGQCTPVTSDRLPAYNRSLLTMNCFIGPQPMWRKSLHEKYGYFDETFETSGDWEFWLRIARDTTFFHISEYLGLYLRSPKSIEHGNADRKNNENRILYRNYVPRYLPELEDRLGNFLKTNPDDRDMTFLYGQVLAAFEKYGKAIDLYSAYLKSHSSDKEFSHALEDIKRSKQQWRKNKDKSKTGSRQTLSGPADRTRTEQGKEKTMIKVSAIVSAYNAERFMRGCLEDLVGQTLYQQDKLEIVVVDSGSGQNEKAVVEEFMQRHKNILYIRTRERESVYAAWNRGIKAAGGEYITNANTDDRHRKDALEVMAALLDQNPGIGLVYADVIITETENETFEKHTPAGHFQWPDYDREKLSLGCYIGPQPMWRKSVHEKYGYFDETFSSSGDWEFWLRIAEDTMFLHVPGFLGLYLRSQHSLEHQNAGQRIKEDRTVYKTYIPKYMPAYEEYFTRITATDSGPVHVYRYGQILAAFEDYEKAIGLYSSFLRKNPYYEGFNFLLSDLKTLQAQHGAAQSPPPSALPEEVMALINEADAHIAAHDPASAREAIKQALRHTSGHPQLAAMLSHMLASLGPPEAGDGYPGTKGKDR